MHVDCDHQKLKPRHGSENIYDDWQSYGATQKTKLHTMNLTRLVLKSVNWDH